MNPNFQISIKAANYKLRVYVFIFTTVNASLRRLVYKEDALADFLFCNIKKIWRAIMHLAVSYLAGTLLATLRTGDQEVNGF